MKKKKLEIKKLNENDLIPFDLLLIADPSKKQIEKYYHKGICLIAILKGKIIGAAVLNYSKPDVLEIKNIAIDNSYQGKGFGKKLLKYIIKYAKKSEAKALTIGTGNSSIGQLALYQKVGFEIDKIINNFFIENYSEMIFENGIQCKHLVMLKMKFE